jgi:hypothetical protein
MAIDLRLLLLNKTARENISYLYALPNCIVGLHTALWEIHKREAAPMGI